MSKLKIIRKASEIKELIAHCKTTGYASVDFETTGFNYYSPNEYPLILGVSFQPGSSWIIPLQHADSPFKGRWGKMFKRFCKEVIENWDIVKVCWNLKFEYKWFMAHGIFMKGRLMDAMLAKYCLDEERPHGLKPFVEMFFPKYAGYENDIKMSEDGEEKKVDWRRTDYLKLCKYCGIDCDLTLRAMIFMEKKLIKEGFYNLFRNMLMMMTRVLGESEFRGMPIDRPYLLDLIAQYKVKLADSDKKLRSNRALLKYEKNYKVEHLNKLVKGVQLEIAQIKNDDTPNAERLISNRVLKIKGFLEGKFNNKERYDQINFGSPKQLIPFLFESKHGLRLPIKERTESGQPSTGEETLLNIKHLDKTGFIDALLANRGLAKLDSTYISGMLPNLDHLDRVHANFKIHGTVTGRLSCVNPNLQNIPRDTTASDIKRMFIPPKGYLLLEVDYSQAELRLIAEASGDEAMIDIFRRGYNIHTATACKMNGGLHLYDEVKKILKQPDHPKWLFWEKEKKKGKSLNFSIVYQQGDKATAETLKCSEKEAARFKKEWFDQFPKVRVWIKKQKQFAHANGYVFNIFGRKRRLHDIHSDRSWMVSEAERFAVNAPIQGGSGDFTSFSQVVIREEQLKGNFPRDMLQAYTVHDSIGFYIRPRDIHKCVPKIIEICDNPQTKKYFGFELKHVTMKVSPEVGRHWANLSDYNPTENYNTWIQPKASAA